MNLDELERCYGLASAQTAASVKRVSEGRSSGGELSDVIFSSDEEALTPSRPRGTSRTAALEQNVLVLERTAAATEERLDQLIADSQAHQESVAKVFAELAHFVTSDSNYSTSLGRRLRGVLRATSASRSPSLAMGTTNAANPQTAPSAAVRSSSSPRATDHSDTGHTPAIQVVVSSEELEREVARRVQLEVAALEAKLGEADRRHEKQLRALEKRLNTVSVQTSTEATNVVSPTPSQGAQPLQLEDAHVQASKVARATEPSSNSDDVVNPTYFLTAVKQVEALAQRVVLLEQQCRKLSGSEEDTSSSSEMTERPSRQSTSRRPQHGFPANTQDVSAILEEELSHLEDLGADIHEIKDLYNSLQSQIRSAPPIADSAAAPPLSEARQQGKAETTPHSTSVPAVDMDAVRKELFDALCREIRQQLQRADMAPRRDTVTHDDLRREVGAALRQMEETRAAQIEHTKRLLDHAQEESGALCARECRQVFEQLLAVIHENRDHARVIATAAEKAVDAKLHTQREAITTELYDAIEARAEKLRQQHLDNNAHSRAVTPEEMRTQLGDVRDHLLRELNTQKTSLQQLVTQALNTHEAQEKACIESVEARARDHCLAAIKAATKELEAREEQREKELSDAQAASLEATDTALRTHVSRALTAAKQDTEKSLETIQGIITADVYARIDSSQQRQAEAAAKHKSEVQALHERQLSDIRREMRQVQVDTNLQVQRMLDALESSLKETMDQRSRDVTRGCEEFAKKEVASSRQEAALQLDALRAEMHDVVRRAVEDLRHQVTSHMEERYQHLLDLMEPILLATRHEPVANRSDIRESERRVVEQVESRITQAALLSAAKQDDALNALRNEILDKADKAAQLAQQEADLRAESAEAESKRLADALDDLRGSVDTLKDKLEAACSQDALDSVFGEVKDWLTDLERRALTSGQLTQAVGKLEDQLSELRRDFYIAERDEAVKQ